VEWLQIITLALLQGITEFLPISSSAHLILPAALTDWPDQGLAFDVAVHLGTLTAVCTFFSRELGGYTTGCANSLRTGQLNDSSIEVAKLAVATLPVVVCGFVLKDWIEASLRSVQVIAIATIVFGLLLAFADRRHGQSESISFSAAAIIGGFQTLALIPGTSRSGITITAALLLGLSRTVSARFSFLLSIPTIAGAALLTTLDLRSQPEAVDWGSLAAGAALAGISAYLCIDLFIRLVERTGMMPYVYYRLVLGAGLLIIAGAGLI
jgi:undecaprenyl-diphosphatase